MNKKTIEQQIEELTPEQKDNLEKYPYFSEKKYTYLKNLKNSENSNP